MQVIIAQWLTRAEAHKIRRQCFLDNMDDNRRIFYIAKADLGNKGDNSRRTWLVSGDAVEESKMIDRELLQRAYDCIKDLSQREIAPDTHELLCDIDEASRNLPPEPEPTSES